MIMLCEFTHKFSAYPHASVYFLQHIRYYYVKITIYVQCTYEPKYRLEAVL